MEPKDGEPEVEIVDAPETELEDGDSPSQVVVDLDKKPEPKGTETPKGDVQPRQSEDIRKLNNTIAYQNRKLEQAMRELQTVRQEMSNSRNNNVQKERVDDRDEIDEIAQKDWKLGVKKVVEKDIEAKVQEILSRRDQAVYQQQKQFNLETKL